MAAPWKKRALLKDELNEDENSSDGPDSENEELIDEDEEDGDLNEIIQVEFEAHEPNGGDFDGIKRLLQQLFLKAHVDTSALADIIIQQSYVGNVIKQSLNPEDSDDEDDDVTFGLTTVVNITERQELPCIQQLRKLLLDHCSRHGTLECQHVVDQLLKRIKTDEHHVGFIINERLVNIPSKIAAPAFESLLKDIQEAVKRNQRFNFDYYILVCKVYKLATANKRGKGNVETNVYPKSEEEIFKDESLCWFEYSISGEADSGLQDDWDADDEGMAPFHQVLIIQSNKLEDIISKVKSTV